MNWIPINIPPEDDQQVLITDSFDIGVGYFTANGDWYILNPFTTFYCEWSYGGAEQDTSGITHWAEIPKLPIPSL